MSRFEVGKGYWATNTATNKKSVVVALGIVDGVPTFAKIRDFGDAKTMYRLDGREFAHVAFGDGVYSVSSIEAVDVADARYVLNAVVK